MKSKNTWAIRREHDGLKLAEVKADCLILRQKHHGETHVQVVPLSELLGGSESESRTSSGGGR